MTEHFDRHRRDAEDLAAFAAARGLPMSPERAYRAWCSHSDSLAAGWISHSLEGEEGDRVGSILEGEEERLAAQDAALLINEGPDVTRLHERAELSGYGMSREDVARAWADYSATQGVDWASIRHADLDAVLEPCRRDGTNAPVP